MMIRVEKDVPIPNPKRGNGQERKYPWAEMLVGESFMVPAKKGRGLMAAATGFIKRNPGLMAGRKFAQRKVEDGIRIWRIA